MFAVPHSRYINPKSFEESGDVLTAFFLSEVSGHSRCFNYMNFEDNSNVKTRTYSNRFF